jgi:hypothetical protein
LWWIWHDAIGRMRVCAEMQSGTEHQWCGKEEGGVWQTVGRQVAWRGVVGFLMFEWTGEMPQRQRIARRLQVEPARWQQSWKQATCPSGGPGVVC